jgi:hypothetical protein
MKLNELSIPETRDDTVEVLTDAGWMLLDSGSMADVWIHPKLSYCLKIFDSEDQGYIEFLGIAMAHQYNPHFPKIHKGLVRLSPNWYAVRMEKLDRCVSASVASRIDNWFDFLKRGAPVKIRHGEEQLFEAIEIMVECIKELKSGVLDDIHSGNIMYRGDTLVFIDPFTG